MVVLIVGGSGSGKSAVAENMVMELDSSDSKVYIATMLCSDDDAKRRVEKHRLLRAGKGFVTVEKPVEVKNVPDCLDGMEKTALLECVSNLVANEMFNKDLRNELMEGPLYEGIFEEIAALSDSFDNLFIVTNNVFDDGRDYDSYTEEYLENLGRLNELLAEFADEVYEVVAGIPVQIKRAKS